MRKPTTKIYRETKPAHYVGADCSITLKYRSDIEEWEIAEIERMIADVLKLNDYVLVED